MLKKHFSFLKNNIYNKLNLNFTYPKLEKEGRKYGASHFTLHNSNIIFRISRITPTKNGQFVTLWKRNLANKTEAFNVSDNFDFVLINSNYNDFFGQFVFKKSVLLEHKIISNSNFQGKRGFRVYPPWDKPNSKQAKSTQHWQIKYFIRLDGKINLKRFLELISS